ncbi:recombinase family protein [Bacillus atrophaeus]|uniref:recombinase family protein n=1 Tax=Bacillus atrophaeus TaxID=1452 RepID=UPI001EFA3A46|nr:recombinase family protein [Bacillus atrophaeus]MCG8398124.1 recombinase family protein [Bacillus atrophaeus]
MLIGYMRPSHEDPDCAAQEEKLRIYNGIKLFREEHSSAKRRVQLEAFLQLLQKDDKVMVSNLSSLADSTRHLAEVLQIIEKKGAFLHSVKEKIDTSNPDGYSFIDIVKHLVEFQSDLISERTKKGLLEAKEKGIATGRPRKPDENVQRAIAMYESKKYSLAQIKEETGISKSTLYRYLDKLTCQRDLQMER